MICTRNVFAVRIVFATVGFVNLMTRSTPSVHAHEPDADHVVDEYNVSAFPVYDPMKQTEILNRNGAQRWEYVGLIQPLYTQDGAYLSKIHVAFVDSQNE
ncbi:secreted protein [Rhodopirellula sp. SWK7]|nr:secreted protein [Rhodopirellula sp. SWK7]